LFTTTPDKLDGKEEVTYKLPPIPTPPETIKDPVEEDVDTAEDVTANPDVDKINEDGLKKIDKLLLEEANSKSSPLTLKFLP